MILLRDYQLEIIDKVRHSLKSNRRVLLQLPTGAGKTACSTFMLKSAHNRGLSTMFCVHRNELMHQAHRTFKQFNLPHGFVSSGIQYSPEEKSHIAMIDTLRRRLDKINIPKLIVVDEAHHATSKTWSSVLDYFSNSGSIIIGLSATPRRMDGGALGALFDDLVCGPSVSELLKIGHLSPYKYYAPPPIADLSDIKIKYGDYDQKELAYRIDKPQVFGDAIKHYLKLLPGENAIAFNVNIQASKNFALQCSSHGINCVHVDGDTPLKDRELAIRNFEDGKIKILSNVGLFGEGFDVKNCKGVILLRKTSSLPLYLQMVGRMMRPCDGKEYGIILDHMNNVNVHGLPDEDREWSLSGIPKKSNPNEDDDIKIRQCNQCFYVYRPQTECPKCGNKTAPTKKEIEIIEMELEEIKKIEKKSEIGRARTLADLQKIAAERGYKKEWAKIIYNSRRR